MADPGAVPPPADGVVRSGTWVREVVVVSAIVAVGALPLSMTGAMAVQIQDELGFGDQGLGAAYAIFFGVAAVASIVLGPVTERIGATRALRSGTVLAGAVFLAIAGLADSWAALAGVLAVGGVATAFARPAANLWLVRVIPTGHQGIAFGVKNTSIPLATIVAGLSVPVLALTVGWRMGFVAGAGLTMLALPFMPTGAGQPTPGTPVDRAGDLPYRLLVRLGAAMACGTVGSSSLNAFTVVSVVDAGIEEGAAGVLFAAASVVGITSRIVVGHLADRRTGGHLRFVAMMLLTGAIGFALFSVAHPVAAIVAAPLTFATAWGWIGLFNLAVVRLNPGAPAAATGVTQAGAFVGGVAGPLGLGTLAEHHSFSAMWLTAAGLAAIGAVLLLATRGRVRGYGAVHAGQAADATGAGPGDSYQAPGAP